MQREEVRARLRSERDEQYSRRENVRIVGIEEKVGEDLEEIVIEVGRKVGVDIEREDISDCHRVGARKQGVVSRQIITRFMNRKKKKALIEGARKNAKNVEDLKGKVYINEDLTDMRQKMCSCLRKCEKVMGVTTVNGNILCFFKEVRHDGRNVMRKVEGPEDLAEVLGESVKSVLGKIGLREE